MDAQKLMTFPALSIRSDLPSAEALVFAKMKRIHHLPLEENGNIVALVCTCDLRDLDVAAPVSKGVKRQPVVVSPSDTSRDIAETMRRECVSSVLVRGSEGWGIVTKDDLLGANLEDPGVLELIEACRCMYCNARMHLRPHGENDFACVDCLERARQPGQFEGGEVD